MNKYELMYIIDTELDESARKELIEKVNGIIAENEGVVEKVDETWGKRRLAYTINYKTEGWYVLVNFQGPSALPQELARRLSILEEVIRYLTVKLEEKQSHVKPRAVRVTEEAAPAVEETVEAAAVSTDAE